jgi:polyhydroxybutyrate depolymerase
MIAILTLVACFIPVVQDVQSVDTTLEWTLNVDGLERRATVCFSQLNEDVNRPLVFVFHGHGGNAQQVRHRFRLEREWPEAIVVYMQGIPTPGQLTDRDGLKNGWQHRLGDQKDRDIKFFDAVFEKLKSTYSINLERVYATGHSNGGAFTFLLWEARPDRFAAFAPSATAAGRNVGKLAPKPVLVIAGKNDRLVKFQWQQASIRRIVESNGCHQEPMPANEQPWKEYQSKSKTPVMTYIHEGSHQFPDDAPTIIVKFFRDEPWKKSE